MRTITLEVEDNNYNSFLTIIENLKDGFIKSFTVENKNLNDIESVSYEEQQEYEDTLNALTIDDKSISSRELISI
jgi:hypothetical protein